MCDTCAGKEIKINDLAKHRPSLTDTREMSPKAIKRVNLLFSLTSSPRWESLTFGVFVTGLCVITEELSGDASVQS
jgi:hypothetical protein